MTVSIAMSTYFDLVLFAQLEILNSNIIKDLPSNHPNILPSNQPLFTFKAVICSF